MKTGVEIVKRFLLALVLLMMPLQAHAQVPMPATPVEAPRPAPLSPMDGYMIGADDVIEIDVLGQPEFKTRSRVKADGTMPLPFLGSVPVSGKTSTGLAADIAGRLRAGGYYANPIVNVEIASYASRYVIVLGEVAQPGLQPVDRAYRVSEIIARAGGIRPSGADYVVVRREKGGELKLPFKKLAMGTAEDDPFVAPGDKVYVPAAETFYIYGQVNAPGVYPITDEMTLRKALARAGGISPNGSEKRIKIFHEGKPQAVELERNVQPGDVIVVGERLF